MLTLRHPDFAKSDRDDVEVFVEKQKALGIDVRWDGWDLVFFRPDPRAVYQSTDGAFRNGAYGFENRVSANGAGIWEVDHRNVRRSKRTSGD